MAKIYHLNHLSPNSSFCDGDKKIIENTIGAIKSKSVVDICSITQVNHTSRSPISRLSKRAGFNNFKESISFLSNEFPHKSISQLEALLLAMMNQDQDLIDSYFDNAFSDRKIYLFGEGSCQALVNYTCRELLLKKTYVTDLEGAGIGLVSDQISYTLITFSQLSENRNGLLKMEEYKKYGSKVIALTVTENSSYTVRGDLSFIVGGGSTSIDHENQNLNYFSGNYLNLMEYLINHYVRAPKA